MSEDQCSPEDQRDAAEKNGPIVHEDDERVYFFFKADDQDAIDQIVAAWAKKFGKLKS